MEHSKLRDTDRDSTKPDDNEGKEQQMYIWNSKFKVRMYYCGMTCYILRLCMCSYEICCNYVYLSST